jgi:hypothetical protein
MNFYAKLAIFWVVLFGALWALRRFPESRAAYVAYSWQGPVPAHGERYSSFLQRRSRFLFGWFVQVAAVFFAMWVAVAWLPTLAESPVFLAFWVAFSLLGGTFFLAFTIYSLQSLKHCILGPDPTYIERGDQGGEV